CEAYSDGSELHSDPLSLSTVAQASQGLSPHVLMTQPTQEDARAKPRTSWFRFCSGSSPLLAPSEAARGAGAGAARAAAVARRRRWLRIVQTNIDSQPKKPPRQLS